MKIAPVSLSISFCARNDMETKSRETPALVMHCSTTRPYLTCLGDARAEFVRHNMPVLTVYAFPGGSVAYTLVTEKDVRSVNPEDVLPDLRKRRRLETIPAPLACPA